MNPGRGWNDLDCNGPRHLICRIPKGMYSNLFVISCTYSRDFMGIQDIIYLMNPGKGWNDLDCNGPRHWICRIPKGMYSNLFVISCTYSRDRGIQDLIYLMNPGKGWNDLDCNCPRHWICRIPKGMYSNLFVISCPCLWKGVENLWTLWQCPQVRRQNGLKTLMIGYRIQICGNINVPELSVTI